MDLIIGLADKKEHGSDQEYWAKELSNLRDPFIEYNRIKAVLYWEDEIVWVSLNLIQLSITGSEMKMSKLGY